ncbi:MAG: SIR2 family protein, partial [Saprospiraceae bacterium]
EEAQNPMVLVIGPDFWRVNGQPVNQALNEFLEKRNQDEIEFYDYKDELFFFKGSNPQLSKSYVHRNLRKFYDGLSPTPLHEQIARLPIPLIINLSPDTLLVQAFKQLQIAHEFKYYHKGMNRDLSNANMEAKVEEAIFRTSSERPLIYNLMGNTDDLESLVFTYSDLFKFLYNVFGDNNLPLSLRHLLNHDRKDKNYLFLGFRFNQWYMQMLLQLLQADEGQFRFVLGEGIGLLETQPDSQDRSFFYIKNHFALKNYDSDPRVFTNRVYLDFEKKNLLRPIGTLNAQQDQGHNDSNGSILYHVRFREWLSYNKVNEVLEGLAAFFRNNKDDYQNNVLLSVSSRYRDWEYRDKKGLLRSEDRQVERSTIICILDDLIGEVQKMENQLIATEQG